MLRVEVTGKVNGGEQIAKVGTKKIPSFLLQSHGFSGVYINEGRVILMCFRQR